ncbi:MAG: hypothetical protein ABIP51_06860 [Bacteroidia bacterium]
MNWLSISGLVIDIVGALYLFQSTELLNDVIIKISESNRVTNTQGSSVDIGKAMAIGESKPIKIKAKRMSKIGLILLVLGFFLQLLGTIIIF